MFNLFKTECNYCDKYKKDIEIHDTGYGSFGWLTICKECKVKQDKELRKENEYLIKKEKEAKIAYKKLCKFINKIRLHDTIYKKIKGEPEIMKHDVIRAIKREIHGEYWDEIIAAVDYRWGRSEDFSLQCYVHTYLTTLFKL